MSSTSISRDTTINVAIVSICTQNYLAFAKTMFDGVRWHHPDASLYLCMVDPEPETAAELPGVTVLPASTIDVPNLAFLALKFTPTQLCCVLKPFVIRHLFTHTSVRRVVYLDADVDVHSRLDALIDPLDDASFVVTPHVLAPFPSSLAGMTRPSLGDLACAGLLNAGVFAVRRGESSRRFLETWSDLGVDMGSFLSVLGGQTDQHVLSWVLAFADRVIVLQNPAFNVGYWNLHDRSIRWKGLDSGENASWTVNGRPLACFHFSGFTPEEPFKLSKFDQRYAVPLLFSISRLLEDYARRLLDNGWSRFSRNEYGFARFPSGIPITELMRDVFKEIESCLDVDVDPFTPSGEQYYCNALLSPQPCYASLMPAILDAIRGRRADLMKAAPDADVDPESMIRWFVRHGKYEFNCEALLDQHRPVVPNTWDTPELYDRLRATNLLAGLSAPLTTNRAVLRQRLVAAGRQDLIAALDDHEGEIYTTTIMGFLFEAYAGRKDLTARFPDLLGADAEAFAHWLARTGVDELVTTPKVVEVFRRCANGGSLARLFSAMTRVPWIMERWPKGLVGHDAVGLARALLHCLKDGAEFDFEDLVTFLWTMPRNPSAGLELTIELPVNLARSPASRLPEGQDALFAEEIATNRSFRHALDAYRRRYQSADALAETQWLRRWSTIPRGNAATDVMMSAFKRQTSDGLPRPGRVVSLSSGLPAGANVFGYFKSFIGLGEMTRGVAAALDVVGVRVREITVPNVAMDSNLRPEDFVRRFDYRLPLNLFISYPHLDADLLGMYPRWMSDGRTNIAYLAWEQRDGAAHWREMYERFDHVWAISQFSARSLERHLSRSVEVVNCVLDTAKLPPRITKPEAGLRNDRFAFLYAFDANSSIERKHPEAALRAFERAFAPTDPVMLYLKVAHPERTVHKPRLRRVIDHCRAIGSQVQLITENFDRDRVLGLISAADCYVSLHRAEGFGYTCAEALAYARPVIATRYSGNLDYMTDENSFLVTAREVDVEYPEGPFHRGSVWAEADVDHAAACMREVYEKRAEASARAVRGARDVERLLSPQAISQQILNALTAVRAPHRTGERSAQRDV